MMRLIRGTLVIVTILSLIGAGVRLIAQGNPAPDRLQALGFDICNGAPCWRGIKVGMEWQQAKRLLPEAIEQTERLPYHLTLFVRNPGLQKIKIWTGRDGKTVEAITASPEEYDETLPPFIMAGDAVMHYGLPCRVESSFHPDGSTGQLHLIYPKVLVTTTYLQQSIRLRVDSAVDLLITGNEEGYRMVVCEDSIGHQVHPWYGFTSGRVYEIRTRRIFDRPSIP
jgi:hypothetical protein